MSDQHLVAFVLDGLRNGFRLGFQHSKQLKSAKSNKASANQHSEVIDRYLGNEVSLGRVAGPFSSPPFPQWLQFLPSWHGVYFWLFPGMSASPDLEVTSDASGSLGFGAYFNGEWFSGPWVSSQASHSITYKELFPIVIAAHVWGPHFATRHVLFRTDNEAVVYILNSRTSRIPVLMRLLCHLLASAARFNISPLPLNMFLGFIIALLTLCPPFIGRSSGG